MSICIAWHKVKTIQKSQCFTFPTEDLEWEWGMGKSTVEKQKVLKITSNFKVNDIFPPSFIISTKA